MSLRLIPRGEGLTFKQTVFPRTRPQSQALGARPPRAAPIEVPGNATAPPAAGAGIAASELAARREVLTRQFAKMQWDLGGLTYEMAIRDHFRLDVLLKRAAELQALDAELGAVERLLRMEEAGAAGNCSACGALYPRGAGFCWQCGHDLVRRESLSALISQTPGHQPTAPVATGAPQR